MEKGERADGLSKVVSIFSVIVTSVFILFLLDSCNGDDPVLDDDGDGQDTVDLPPNDSTETDTTAVFYPDCVEDPMDGLFQTGCNEIYIVKHLDTTSRHAISIAIDTAVIKVRTECQTFQLPKEGILVNLLTVGNDPDSIYFYFCNGIQNSLVAEPFRDPLLEGTLMIGASSSPEERDSVHFEVSAVLDSAVFTSERIDTTIYNTVFYQISQGWAPV